MSEREREGGREGVEGETEAVLYLQSWLYRCKNCHAKLSRQTFTAATDPRISVETAENPILFQFQLALFRLLETALCALTPTPPPTLTPHPPPPPPGPRTNPPTVYLPFILLPIKSRLRTLQLRCLPARFSCSFSPWNIHFT